MTDRSDAGLGLSPDDELTAHRALVDAGYMPPAAYNAAHPRQPEPLPVAIPVPVSHYAATAARRIMDGLRERGALCYILARQKPDSGVAWAPPEVQAAMENRMAQIIDAVLDARISELLAANNREVERRREGEHAAKLEKEILLTAVEHNYKAAIKAETERDTLRARVARMEGALIRITEHPFESEIPARPNKGLPGFPSCQSIARAALTPESAHD